jgi:uncharacterized protein (DUF169 family)
VVERGARWKMFNWKEIAEGLEDFLRLRTFPLGVKFLEKEEDLAKIEKVRRPEFKMTMCQAISHARILGWTIGITVKDLAAPPCMIRLGFIPTLKSMLDGTQYAGIWLKTKEDAAKYARILPSMPLNKFRAVIFSPLASGRLDPPDIVLIFGTPAQMCLLLNGLQWEGYERFKFFFSGEGSCADSLIECYYSGKPQLTIPCFGERVFGLVQDDELEIAIPANMVQKALNGLRELRAARTISYPIPFYGFRVNVVPFLSKIYPSLEEIFAAVERGEVPE